MKSLRELVETGALLNCTPHDVNILLPGKEEEEDHVLKASGKIVRAAQTKAKELAHGVFDTARWEVPVLPAPQEGVFFVVALAVSSAMQFHGIRRDDIVIGGTGPDDNPRRHPVKKFVTGWRKIKFANR